MKVLSDDKICICLLAVAVPELRTEAGGIKCEADTWRHRAEARQSD